MSKFKTVIRVDVEEVVKRFPKGAGVEAVRFNALESTIEVYWECHALVTPYTFPVEFPIEQLEKQELPAQTSPRSKVQSPKDKYGDAVESVLTGPARKGVSRQNQRKVSTAKRG